MVLAVNCLSKKTALYHKCTNFILYLFSGVKKNLIWQGLFFANGKFLKISRVPVFANGKFSKILRFQPQRKKISKRQLNQVTFG